MSRISVAHLHSSVTYARLKDKGNTYVDCQYPTPAQLFRRKSCSNQRSIPFRAVCKLQNIKGLQYVTVYAASSVFPLFEPSGRIMFIHQHASCLVIFSDLSPY